MPLRCSSKAYRSSVRAVAHFGQRQSIEVSSLIVVTSVGPQDLHHQPIAANLTSKGHQDRLKCPAGLPRRRVLVHESAFVCVTRLSALDCRRAAVPGMDDAAIQLLAEGLQASFEAVNEVARDLPMRRQEQVQTVTKRILSARMRLSELLERD